MKLRFTHAASPPIQNAEQLVQHLRHEVQALSTLDANAALRLNVTDHQPNNSDLSLSLDGLRVLPANILDTQLTEPHATETTVQFASITLQPSNIRIESSEGTSCEIGISGRITDPTIVLLEKNGATLGGALTGFQSASLELVFPKQLDRLLNSLLPELVLKQTGVTIRDVQVRSESATDSLNIFLVASVKAFVMNATGRASASIVREGQNLFVRDLQAHTDAAMLSSLLSGYVKSFTADLSETPIPLSLGGITLRCTALSPVAEQHFRACFQAP